MYSIDDCNRVIYECDMCIRKIKVGNGVLLSCELISFILCSGLPLDYIVFIMCLEAILFKYVIYIKYGSKSKNYEIKNDYLEKKEKILELKR